MRRTGPDPRRAMFGDFDAAQAFHSKLTAGHRRMCERCAATIGPSPTSATRRTPPRLVRGNGSAEPHRNRATCRMPDYPQLVYLSVPELIAAAGGDPWQVDDTIQSGAPGEISELADSFYNAGCLDDSRHPTSSPPPRSGSRRPGTATTPRIRSMTPSRSARHPGVAAEQGVRSPASASTCRTSRRRSPKPNAAAMFRSAFNGRLVTDRRHHRLRDRAGAGRRRQQLDWSALKIAAVDAPNRAWAR